MNAENDLDEAAVFGKVAIAKAARDVRNMNHMRQAAMKLSGIKPKLVNETLFVALPAELRRPIDGGCNCPYCKSHPSKTPAWDTLAIDTAAERRTWTVHYPELTDAH